MSRTISFRENIRPIFAAIRTVPIAPKPGSEPAPPPAEPFITLSREAGAGAWTLAQKLVESLNADDPGGRPWTCWDRELVEKVCADHHLSKELIDSLEDTSHSWLGDFLGSLSFSDSQPLMDEARAYNRVAATIRALAQAGRVVIVGRGGVFITRRMPGGIHVRLVAPLEYRIGFMAQLLNLSADAARVRVREMERNRSAFYKRYWPGESLSAETFTMTINTAMVDLRTMIETIKVLTRQPAMAR